MTNVERQERNRDRDGKGRVTESRNERWKGCEMEGKHRKTKWGGRERKETEDRARERGQNRDRMREIENKEQEVRRREGWRKGKRMRLVETDLEPKKGLEKIEE